jgi:hypothetical protein
MDGPRGRTSDEPASEVITRAAPVARPATLQEIQRRDGVGAAEAMRRQEALTALDALIPRLRLHAYELLNGGANAGQLRADLNAAADVLSEWWAGRQAP